MCQLLSKHTDTFQFLFFEETRSGEPLLPASELKNNLHPRYPSIISVLTTWPIHEILQCYEVQTVCLNVSSTSFTSPSIIVHWIYSTTIEEIRSERFRSSRLGQQCWHTVSMLRPSCDPQNKPAFLAGSGW